MLRFSAEPISSSKLANHLNNIKSLSARGQPSVLLTQKEFSRPWGYRPKKKNSEGQRRTIYDIFAKENNTDAGTEKTEGKAIIIRPTKASPSPRDWDSPGCPIGLSALSSADQAKKDGKKEEQRLLQGKNAKINTCRWWNLERRWLRWLTFSQPTTKANIFQLSTRLGAGACL